MPDEGLEGLVQQFGAMSEHALGNGLTLRLYVVC